MMPSIQFTSDYSSISKSSPIREQFPNTDRSNAPIDTEEVPEPTLPPPTTSNTTETTVNNDIVDEVEAQLKRALTPSAPTRSHSSLKKKRFGNASSSALSTMTDTESELNFVHTTTLTNPNTAVLDPLNALGLFEQGPTNGNSLNTTPSVPLKSEPPLHTPRSGTLDASASLGTSTSDLAGALATSFEEKSYLDDGIAGPWNEEKLVKVLTNDVEDLCFTNESASQVEESAVNVQEELRIFFSQYKQPFAMEFYVTRLVQYSNCSTAAFITALVYLDRVHAKCTSLAITEMNCHRLLSTALVLAIKYLDDEVYSNAYYARVSGLTTNELNTLETVMLSLLEWRLSIDPAVYVRYEHTLRKTCAILESDIPPSTPEF